MKKSELVKLIREELRGWSPQVGQTKGLTPDTLNKILKRIASDDEYTPDAEVEEGAGNWPEEVPSRHGDIIFKLVKVMPDRAKYALIDTETGKEWEPGGRVYNTPDQVKAAAADTIKPQGGRQSSHFGTK